MNCWKCGALIEARLSGKISFRDVCERCSAALHCCKNCKYYKPGMYNDCAVPGTEYVSDRTTNNFCEEFSPLGKQQLPNPQNNKNKFDDLFK